VKIFLDTADIEKIKEYDKTGLIDGITTNPTNLSKEGGDPKKIVLEICSIMKNREVSIEVTEKEPKAIYNQAKKIAALSENVLVKIPCHKDYYEIIHNLVQEGIRLNITLVFTTLQALFMAKLGVNYISPFIGRWDDIGVDAADILQEVRHMLDEYSFSTKLLAASIRGIDHFKQAILSGADVVTVPIDVFEKSIEHILTDQGIKKFDSDWQKLGIRNFP
jgi:transaldolase